MPEILAELPRRIYKHKLFNYTVRMNTIDMEQDLINDNEAPPYFHAPLPAQLLIGAVCGVLNIVIIQIVNILHIPFFLDEILVVTAALFGWASGLCCIGTHKLISLLVIALTNPETLSFVPFDSLFCICDIAVVIVIRILFAKARSIQPLTLFLCGIVLAVLISILGGAVFSFLFYVFNYGEIALTHYLTLLLTSCHLPLPAAAMISRMPVNLIDKPLSVFIGCSIAWCIQKYFLPPPLRLSKNSIF